MCRSDFTASTSFIAISSCHLGFPMVRSPFPSPRFKPPPAQSQHSSRPVGRHVPPICHGMGKQARTNPLRHDGPNDKMAHHLGKRGNGLIGAPPQPGVDPEQPGQGAGNQQQVTEVGARPNRPDSHRQSNPVQQVEGATKHAQGVAPITKRPFQSSATRMIPTTSARRSLPTITMRLGNLDQAAGKQKLQIPHCDEPNLGAPCLAEKTRLGKRLRHPPLRKQALFLLAFRGYSEKLVSVQPPARSDTRFCNPSQKNACAVAPGIGNGSLNQDG